MIRTLPAYGGGARLGAEVCGDESLSAKPHTPGAVRSAFESTSEGAEEIKTGDSAGRNRGPDQRDANP